MPPRYDWTTWQAICFKPISFSNKCQPLNQNGYDHSCVGSRTAQQERLVNHINWDVLRMSEVRNKELFRWNQATFYTTEIRQNLLLVVILVNQRHSDRKYFSSFGPVYSNFSLPEIETLKTMNLPTSSFVPLSSSPSTLWCRYTELRLLKIYFSSGFLF